MADVHRRQLIRGLGLSMIAIPLGRVLAACGENHATVDAGSALDAVTAAAAWATGGTAAMTDKASYPNPFASGVPTVCAPTCAATQGPCWSSAAEVIQDISYGQLGLPVRFYFQIVDETCAPVANALLDIWHVAPTGKYSGDDAANENIGFCTGNDTTYTSALFFRGKQTTDANGICYFDSCYPGWYSGRTIHVHFIATINGQSTLTSQFVFDDALNDDIIGSQAIYSERGARDTTNSNDNVVSSADAAAYSFSTQRMSDGAMLAWKTIVVRTTSAACELTGSGGGGGGPGDGMPPGDGGMPTPDAA